MNTRDLLTRVDAFETFIQESSNATAFLESWGINHSGKKAIGEYVAANMIDQGVLVLDAGSTSYEVAKSIAYKNEGNTGLRILTNNIPALLVLMLAGIDCSLIGGQLDPLHFCTLPGLENAVFADSMGTEEWTAIVTAASLKFSDTGISVLARRPDQFAFKGLLLETAAKKIVLIDHTKWHLPFDGQYSFELTGTKIDFVVDRLLQDSTEDSDFADAIHRCGYCLHIVNT